VDVEGLKQHPTPGHPLVQLSGLEYTQVIMSFYLPSKNECADATAYLCSSNPADGSEAFVNASHEQGRKVMISAFGATEMPPSEAYFTTITPLKLAATLADIVKAHNLDGVDLD